MIVSRNLKATILNLPGAWLLLIPVRFFATWNMVVKSQIVQLAKWSFASREFTNLSYYSSQTSIKRLAILLSRVEGVSSAAVVRYCAELAGAALLQNTYLHARSKETRLRNLTDGELRPGRQILYYCLTRALKPKVVFEAGTAHGIGSLLIVHALKLNEAEGYPGKLTTVDISPNAGMLLKHMPSDYRAKVDFVLANTEDALRNFPSEIDLFFHDTVNIPSHEQNHYRLLQSRISRSGVICTSWGLSGALADHSERSGRRYFEFTTQAERHWSSDNMGISLPPALKAPLSAMAAQPSRQQLRRQVDKELQAVVD